MAEGKPRALRAVARCSSLEEFIAGFARFAEPERLFIITPDPRPVGGAPQPFVIQLADGSTALRGVGEVVESHLIPTGPEGKCGMWLRLVELNPASVEVHRQLLDQRARVTARIARLSTGPAAAAIAERDLNEPTNVSPPPTAPPIPVPSIIVPPLAPPATGDPSRGLAPLARLRPLPAPGGLATPATGSRAGRDPTPLGAPRAPHRPVIEIPPIVPPRGRGPTMVPPPAADHAPTAAAPPGTPRPAVTPTVGSEGPALAAATPAIAPPVIAPAPEPAELPPAPPAPPAIPLAARRTMIAAVAPPPSVLAAAHASPPPSSSPGDRVTLTDPTPTPARTPLPMSPSTEVRERARRMAGPSPFDEARAPGSPLQLPANPLAALPDEALGYFVECTLYEHTDLAELDGTWAAVGAAAPVAASASAPPAIAPAMAIAAAPTSRRALVAVAGLSVALGIGGGWVLFGRDAAGPDPAPVAVADTPMPQPPPAKAPAVARPAPKAAPAMAAIAPAAIPPPPTIDAAPAARAPDPAPPAIAATAVAPPAEPPPVPGGGRCALAIKTRPAGVRATWGGVDLGMTPIAAAQVPCGPGELVLTHPRYERVARPLTAGAEAAVEVAMARPIGALTLRSIPAGATFTVNGATVGRGPTTAKVPAYETIRLTAQLPGYAPWRGTVKVRGATGTAFARLTRVR